MLEFISACELQNSKLLLPQLTRMPFESAVLLRAGDSSVSVWLKCLTR